MEGRRSWTAALVVLAALRAYGLPLQDVPRLGRIVGREGDLDITAGHPDRECRLDVDAGLAERPRDLGQSAGSVGKRRRHELNRAVLPLLLGQHLPSCGLVIRGEDDRPAIAACRTGESRDIDALVAERLSYLGKLAGLVLELHDERIHGSTPNGNADSGGGLNARRRGPVEVSIVPALST